MKKSCTVCWGISALLLIVVLAMAYLFLLRGNVTASDDGRTAVVVTAAERNKVMGDMRAFLEAVQSITEAAATSDFATASEAARAVGSAATGGESAAFMGKIPLEMKTLGFATHGLFDDLADAAEGTGDAAAVFGALGDLMLNCTACHASYKFVTEKAGR